MSSVASMKLRDTERYRSTGTGYQICRDHAAPCSDQFLSGTALAEARGSSDWEARKLSGAEQSTASVRTPH
jgi:hypothetical protein